MERQPFSLGVQTPRFFDFFAKNTLLDWWSWFFVWMIGFGDPMLGMAGNQGVVRN